ncbi:MAG: PAS domain S-box protein [Burkholderiales bacterium]|nr:PAS domain S-box protein [Burkholderiales bacterium]
MEKRPSNVWPRNRTPVPEGDEHGRRERRAGDAVVRSIEEKLRETEERLRATFENAPLGIAETSPEGVLLRVNEGFCHIVGYAREELEGCMFQSITHRDDLARNLDLFRRLLAGEIPHYEMEKRYVRRDGQVVWAHLFGALVRNRDGTPAYGVAVIQDISERKRAESEREALLAREQGARRQAEEASRLKDEFLATVSHELRTPLNAIVGWSAVARMHQFEPAVIVRALETIERNARAQKQLIEDLLDVSRIITGKLKLEITAVDLRTLMEAALETVKVAAEAKGLQIRSEVAPDVPVIAADFTRLQQVVWNLLANAVKFTPAGGRVNVTVRRLGNEVDVCVRDSGQGIEPQFLPYVFDRFRQQDGSITRRHGGLGLGLAIVRHVAELHGGRVSAHSEGEGQGATFHVLLPVTRPPRPNTIAPEAGGSLDNRDMLAGLRLLVVEDERDSLQMLGDLLCAYGAEVTLADSAARALEWLGCERFDLLLCDIGMPEMDGYALMREVRRREAGSGFTLPAVALTAYGRAEDRVRALSAGFQNHVTKPVEPEELALVVARSVVR